MSERITPNFTWREATHSDTAKRLGLKNNPPVTARTAIEVAAFMMEAARSLCDNRPVNVTSWYRSPTVNAALDPPGSETSDHMSGYAVDFSVSDMDSLEVARRISRSPLAFDQLIWYPSQNRVHLSAAPGRRREVMTKTTGGYIAGLVAP